MKIESASNHAQKNQIELLAEQSANKLIESLDTVEIVEFIQDNMVPDWVHDEMDKIQKITSSPDECLPEPVPNAVALRWIKNRLHSKGIIRKFIVHTGIWRYPWAECRSKGDEWVTELFETVGSDLVFLSEDRSIMATFCSEEHNFEVFYSSETRRRRRGGTLND